MRMKIRPALACLLMALLPWLCLADTLTLYQDVTVDRGAAVLDLGDKRIVDIDRLRGYLDQLPNLKEVRMFGSRLSIAQLEALQAAYPDIAFGCKFPFARGTVSTAQTAYSTLNRLSDPRYSEKRFAYLHLMPELRALDLGHNNIRDLTFLLEAPLLRVLILADNHITDLTPLAELKELEYLELFMNDFTDLSPLAELHNLRDLNICRVRVSDVTPLLQLKKLERLWLPDNFLTESQKAELEAALPGCHIQYEWSRSTDFGWRDHPRYTIIRRMFSTGVYEPFDAPEQ